MLKEGDRCQSLDEYADVPANGHRQTQGQVDFNWTRPAQRRRQPGRRSLIRGWYNAPVGYNAVRNGHRRPASALQPAAVAGPTVKMSVACAGLDGRQRRLRLGSFDYDNTDPEVTATRATRWPQQLVQRRHLGQLRRRGQDERHRQLRRRRPVRRAGHDRVLGGNCSAVASSAVASASYGFKYDAHGADYIGTLEPLSDHNGHLVQRPLLGQHGRRGDDERHRQPRRRHEYDGPDTAGDSLSGSCSDKAGNSASAS